MSFARRDFIKLFGMTVASVLLARCQKVIVPETPTCYEPLIPPTDTSTVMVSSARERLRLCWLRFSELAQKTADEGNTDFSLGQQMIAQHHTVLDELTASGEVSASVAELVQEAYEAAVYHVWRSNVPITCYAPVMVDYAPSSANVLLKQSEVLSQLAEQGMIDPETLARAQTALEHDLAFYDLSGEDVQALYDRLIKESQETGQPIPTFDALQLELTPDAQDASRFLLDLLSGK